ncbi:MAG: Hsp20/alpha crystallin family protein [Hyphomonadaceae bacterium]|nr:Hsp20/alpha crystallin family protein [Hyphomonadaceae bacterium]
MYTTYPGEFSWNPLSELRHMQETMNRMFDSNQSVGRANYPPVNMYSRDDGLLVTAELPGFDNDKLDITVHGDTLRVEGNIAENDSEKADGWHRRERGRGQFARTIDLPYRADPDTVEARFKDGVLEIEMRRPEEDKPRRITVNA